MLKVVDSGQVVGRNSGDEVIIINFLTGVYFSLSGAGTDIWPLLERGADAGAIAKFVGESYGKPEEQIRADLDALTAKLLEYELIANTDATAPPIAATAERSGKAYVSPLLTPYEDLADSFAIDPPLEIGNRKAAAPR